MTLTALPPSENISIHALRGEGDGKLGDRIKGFFISIHALRGEGDCYRRASFFIFVISIHALRGEGDSLFRVPNCTMFVFQSTPSVGRATVERVINRYSNKNISIHALRGEGD